MQLFEVRFSAYRQNEPGKATIGSSLTSGLTTTLDGHKVSSTPDSDLGRVIIDVPKGIHTITAKIGYTPVRLFSDFLTLASIFVLIKLFLYARRHS